LAVRDFFGRDRGKHESAALERLRVAARTDSLANADPEILRQAIDSAELFAQGHGATGELNAWIAVCWGHYASLYVRGDERKPFMERGLHFYRAAFDTYTNDDDRLRMAASLGTILVKEALVRDLDEAEQYLSLVAESTDLYEPCLCAYADLYYKRKDYLRSLETAIDAHNRAVNDPQWGEPPPGPLNRAGKALRALGKQAKKDGNLPAAAARFQQIVDLGVATNNDLRVLHELTGEPLAE